MMTTVTTDLAEFLLARIQEDEDAAQCEQVQVWDSAAGALGDWRTVPGAHKPGDKRALAECAAKRRILELHAPVPWPRCHCGRDHERQHACATCGTGQATIGGKSICDTLLTLALPYADHEDYREEWRP